MSCNLLLYNMYTCAAIGLCKCMCGDGVLIVLHTVLCCIVSGLSPYLCGHSVSMHNAACAVHHRPCELDLFDLRQETLTQHGSATLLPYPSAWCHLSVACAPEASTRSCVSRCGNAAGAFSTSFPTVKGKGGHGHLSCLFSQHTAQGGQAGPVPSPLNSTRLLLSP